MVRLVGCLVALTSVSGESLAACETDLDCSLLGSCGADGRCVCDAGWSGPDCGEADLLPLDLQHGYQNASYASWGGRPIQAEDGQYHVFAAEMAAHCPLSKFDNNSQVMRGVASPEKPQGPYIKAETVVLPMAHNPSIVGPTPEGYYLLFYIGLPAPERFENCTELSIHGLGGKPGTSHINMAYSKSLEGPWLHREVMGPSTDPDLTKWDCHRSNPAPLLLPNGTVLLMFRGTACDRKGSGCGSSSPNNCEKQGIAVAEHWNGTYGIRQGPLPLKPGSFEDAFLWQNSRGFHALYHAKAICGLGEPCGAHAFSVDSHEWISSATPMYNGTVTLSDGGMLRFERRERPQLLLGSHGEPQWLFNGGVLPGAELSHTFAQAFHLGGEATMLV